MQIRNSWYVHLFFEPVFNHFGSIICLFLPILFLWLCLCADRPFHFVIDEYYLCAVCLVAFSQKYSMRQNSIEFVTSLGKHMHDAWIFNCCDFHWYYFKHTYLSLVLSLTTDRIYQMKFNTIQMSSPLAMPVGCYIWKTLLFLYVLLPLMLEYSTSFNFASSVTGHHWNRITKDCFIQKKPTFFIHIRNR